LALLLAILSLINPAKAQDTVLTVTYNSKLDSINSGILHQKRYIQVFIPTSYTPGSSDKYDVLYVLDGGNWNTGLIRQIQRFVEDQGNMPPTLIVSVTGIDRVMELTPTHLENWKTSGNADNFLGYITRELIPYINKTYPSNGDNTLWGHSLSGMFAIYAMLKEPTAFKSFIAADPSIWWDNCLVAKMAATKLPALNGINTTLFISGRQGPELHGMRIDTMETVLQQFAPPTLHWKLIPYPGESHSSVRLKTTYDGLRHTYAGLVSEIQFVPMNGIVQKGKPIQLWYFDDTARVHYTLDGTTPTETSPAVQRDITLDGPAKVTFRRFTNRSRYDKTVTGEFTTGDIPHPVPLPKTAKPGGFHYAYYEGDLDSPPVKTGITDKDFDIDKLPRKNDYSLVIEGLIEIKEDGYHMFLFDADKDSKLYLGGKLLMQWDGNYNRRTYTYILPLAKGFYPFKIEYLHKKEDFGLRYTYLTPRIMNTKNPIPIPLDAQYSVTPPPGTPRSSTSPRPSAPTR
jgi:predicted alpha/beta superfamily hydrolase